MRRGLTFFLALAALAVAGCYDPAVKDGGYSCTAERPHCPSGFTCIGNRCVTEGTTPPPGQDSGQPPEQDLSIGGPDVDMSMPASTDMSGQQSMPDMSKPSKPDMAQQCTAKGQDCTSDDECCSGQCDDWFFFAICH